MRATAGLAIWPQGVIPYPILAVLLMFLIGCSPTENPSHKTLRISMIPTSDPGKILRDSQPFIGYLEKRTGAKVELTVPTNYAAVVEAVSSDRVDIA